MIVVTLAAFDGGVAAKHSHLRDMGVPILFGAVVLLVSATLLLGANISALRSNLNRVDRSQKVLTQISEIESGMLGNELTARGYALTGDPSFLSLEKGGNVRRDKAIAELGRLMADKPQHALKFREVMRAVNLHKANFGKLTGIGPDRAAIVAQAIVDPEIRANSFDTRKLLRELRTAEMGDAAARQREMAGQISSAFFLAMGIIIVAFLLGWAGMWMAQIKGPLKR
jgi:CHASE3 domain sensor protein